MPGHFGIRITDANKEKQVGELDVDDRHLNNSGHVHGGALAAFADDLGGTLAGLNVPPRFRTATIESKTNRSRGRKTRRNDDPDSGGAPKGGGDHLW
jgi:uncharacterized protein (TIGR00369 family)